MTPDRRAALATELLAHIDTWRELQARAAREKAAIRATWAALQAAEAEQRAQVAVRQMGA